jgi:hypothetical protein
VVDGPSPPVLSETKKKGKGNTGIPMIRRKFEPPDPAHEPHTKGKKKGKKKARKLGNRKR